jgi:hypothetical protein
VLGDKYVNRVLTGSEVEFGGQTGRSASRRRGKHLGGSDINLSGSFLSFCIMRRHGAEPAMFYKLFTAQLHSSCQFSPQKTLV